MAKTKKKDRKKKEEEEIKRSFKTEDCLVAIRRCQYLGRT